MWKYLKRAFFATIAVPLLGRVPFNVLGVLVFVILGFGHPAFWLLGLGVETAYLFGLATNKRFQRVVDAMDVQIEETDVRAQRQAMVAQLIPPSKVRLAELESKCAHALELSRKQGADDYLVDSNREALDKLCTLYLRLLLSRQVLSSQDMLTSGSQLRRQLEGLRQEIETPGMPPTVKESKTATLRIVERRLELFQKRGQAGQEIDADLARIEAQVDLAVENASLSTKPAPISGNITLATALLDPELFGTDDVQSEPPPLPVAESQGE